jgi:hypothetical protein
MGGSTSDSLTLVGRVWGDWELDERELGAGDMEVGDGGVKREVGGESNEYFPLSWCTGGGAR